jgi:hypothetical protein
MKLETVKVAYIVLWTGQMKICFASWWGKQTILLNVQTGYGSHLAASLLGIGALSSGYRLGREVDHSPLSTAKFRMHGAIP